MKQVIPFFLIVFVLCVPDKGVAQNQAWMDYILNLPFAGNYVFGTEFSYKTALTKDSKWRSYDITPEVERTITNRLDMMVSVGESFTVQKEGYNTVELKPLIGARYHFTNFNRVLLRAIVRYEQRNLYYEEHQSWSHSNRARLRLESIIALNKKTMFDDKAYYLIADAEFFWVMDQQLNETYANRERFRVGLGYRHSYTWRFEFIYCNQLTKNTIDGNFDTSENIFRFRVKHFINKAKPAKQDPNNN